VTKDADRADALRVVVAPERVAAAQREHAVLERFCDRLRVPIGRDAVCLYLTWLHDQDSTARVIHRRLALLDLFARLRGDLPWTHDPEVRLFLRGLHRDAQLGGRSARADPLYRELVDLLVDAVMAPTPVQLRDRAIILITASTGTPAQALSRITWEHVRWVPSGAVIEVPAIPGSRGGRRIELEAGAGPLCPVRALRRLREATGIGGGHIFGGSAERKDALRIRRTTRLLDLDRDVCAVLKTACVTPRQLRDRAALLIGYGAALQTFEASRLLQGHIAVTPEGVLIAVPGRSQPTAIPADPGMPHDPVVAWTDWLAAADSQSRADPGQAAFLRISGEKIWRDPLKPRGFNLMVHHAATLAGLEGEFSYTSLRIGLIRTALRAGERAHDVAAHAHLQRLNSVGLHERRENLIRHSVAGQLGL